MRIVVVGATGNLGTAVLRRLSSSSRVTEIVGVARRRPDTTVMPYRDAAWHSIDVAATPAAERLTTVFAGADAVIHLAWALQSNRDLGRLWRTNVGGTAAVLAAARAAGVPQVVVASSVGAYSAGPKKRRVDESWPTGGIHTSHYSREKAANERAFDTFEAQNPTTILTRIRPGLVFQEAAGAEIAGLFLGQLIPTGWIGKTRLPVVPLPAQLIFQAVDADDVADAFFRAIDRRAGGSFNIAGEPVLTPELIGNALNAARVQPIRLAALRALVSATWRLGLHPTDPGWIDIAARVPIMSTDRARDVLGWAPTTSATQAFDAVLRGVATGTNVDASAPLRG